MSLVCLIFVLLPFVNVAQYSLIFGPDKLTWIEADAFCNNQEPSLELISIHNETQYNATRLAINQTDPTQKKNYWTGLQHQGTNGQDLNTYSWSDSSSFNYGINFGQFPWRENEPNSGISPSCIRLTNSYEYLWDDVDCNSLQAIPICNNNTIALPPSTSPTKFPTITPTKSPSKSPTKFPSKSPTQFPTKFPTKSPTQFPTKFPTKTYNPTMSPITSSPTDRPTPENAAGVDPITTIYSDVTNDGKTESENGGVIDFNIIIMLCVIVAICCIIITGYLLLKWTKTKRINNTNVEKEIKISNMKTMPPKTHIHKHVQTHSEINMNMELQESVAVFNIKKETIDGYDDIYEPVIDDGRKVTDGYIDDEHDGIISDAHSEHDNSQNYNSEHYNDETVPINIVFHGDEGGYEMENEMETPQHNIANDEFVIENDEDVLTPKDNQVDNTKF